jgi:hypothetical protein
MRDHNKFIEIDFSEQLEFPFAKEVEADQKAGYPPNCNDGYVEKDGKCVKEDVKASEESGECNKEDCGNCDCDTEEAQAEQEMVEVDEYDIGCPSCGCALGRSWMKAGTMRKAVYASKYSELYKKVKAADPQHDVDKQPEIKTNLESQRKIEDMPNSVELRKVDGPIGE